MELILFYLEQCYVIVTKRKHCTKIRSIIDTLVTKREKIAYPHYDGIITLTTLVVAKLYWHPLLDCGIQNFLIKLHNNIHTPTI